MIVIDEAPCVTPTSAGGLGVCTPLMSGLGLLVAGNTHTHTHTRARHVHAYKHVLAHFEIIRYLSFSAE